MNENEIMQLAFAAFDSGEDICRIKMPAANRIHEFNMSLKSLETKEMIKISKRNMTEVCLEITEKGLESFL